MAVAPLASTSNFPILILPAYSRCQRIDRRTDLPAWTAPLRPEIHQNRYFRPRHFPFETLLAADTAIDKQAQYAWDNQGA
jgi:hypothetical protein